MILFSRNCRFRLRAEYNNSVTEIPMNRLPSICIFIFTVLLLFGCGGNSAKQNNTVVTSTTYEEAPVIVAPVKDSVDILMEQRAEQEFNNTIFGNLRFGSSKQAVENAWRNTTYRSVKVPYEERVAKVVFQDYDALYYNGKLASLVLYANEGELYEALGVVYSTKYGKTKNRDWRYSNCEISIKQRIRREHNPHKEAGYGDLDSHRMYYTSYRGERTYYLTKEPYFIEVSYKNFDLLELIARQQFVEDSLVREGIRKEAQKEKEMAEKLATEVATGI